MRFFRFSFNTQPPEGGWPFQLFSRFNHAVSTHSRLKAAGYRAVSVVCPITGFNTQPPEGGWAVQAAAKDGTVRFQHTAA